MKNYTQAPLPFQGQKRRFVKEFRKALDGYPPNAIYVDLFGGSGLLSHTVKVKYTGAKVIYNDFDNYRKRLNAIPETNNILDKLRTILAGFPRGKRITGIYRKNIVKVLEEADKKGYVDYITLSASLKFSMNYSTDLKGFTKETLYNRVRINKYDATNYLSGVEIVCQDYKSLFEEYKSCKNVIYLVDPPYLSTNTATYNSTDYWKLRDYLDVLNVLKGNSYFYFTSNKSQIVELCEWVSTVSAAANPFERANCTKMKTSTTHNAKYVDIMYHYKKD